MNSKLKKDRLCLLQAIEKFIEKGLDLGSINAEIESEVSEFIADFKDKKSLRELKLIHKELKRWIDEIKDSRKTARKQTA
jgi:hypothetical protein